MSDNRREVSDNKREVSDNKREVSDNKREVSDNKREVSDNKREVSDNRREVSENKRGVSDNKREVSDNKREVSDSRREVSDNRREVSDNRREVSDNRREVSDNKRGVSENKREVSENRREVSENKRFDGKTYKSTSPDTECKPVGGHKRSKVPFRHESRSGSSLKNSPKKDKSKVPSAKSSLPSPVRPNGDSKSRGNCKRGVYEITNGRETKSSLKDKRSSRDKEASLERKKKEEPPDGKKGRDGEVKRLDTDERKVKKGSGSANEGQPSEDEKSAMSFESCLSYDLKAPKRRKKPCDGQKPAKKLKVTAAQDEPLVKAPSGNDGAEQPKHSPKQPKESPKKVIFVI